MCHCVECAANAECAASQNVMRSRNWPKATHCRQAHIDCWSHIGAQQPHFIKFSVFSFSLPETTHYLI